MDLTEVPDALAGQSFRRHPWEVARARFFARVLERAGRLSRPCRVLDLGAGDGYVARALLGTMPTGSELVCVDSEYADEDLRRFADPPAPGLSFRRARPPGRFDLVLLLDVVEHVENDGGFLAEIAADALAAGGAVLVSVPAWPFLYSLHDVALKHFRRYSPAAGRALLERSGLRVLASGGLFHSLLVPRLVQRLRQGRVAVARDGGRTPPDLGDWRGGSVLSTAVGAVLALDNRLSHLMARFGREAPGLSWWALCGRAP